MLSNIIHSAFRIEGRCDVPWTTKLSTWLQHRVYCQGMQDALSFLNTFVGTAHASCSILSLPQKKFKPRVSCDKFV